MVGQRALVTLRDSAGLMMWVNDAAMARQLLEAWQPTSGPTEGGTLAGGGDIGQQAAVILAGLQLQQALSPEGAIEATMEEKSTLFRSNDR